MDEENKNEDLNNNGQDSSSTQENKVENIPEEIVYNGNKPLTDSNPQVNNTNTSNYTNQSQPQYNNYAQNLNNANKKRSKAPVIIIIVIITVLILGCLFLGGVILAGTWIYKNINSQVPKYNTYNNSLRNSYSTNSNKSNTSKNNSTKNNTTNAKLRSDAKKSTKESPISVGEWGITSKYSTKTYEYEDLAVKVTKVTRGEEAAKQVKEFKNSSSSLYNYGEPKKNMEWAVIEYEVDFSTFNRTDIGANPDISCRIEGIDSSLIKYKGDTYVTSTRYMGSSEYVKTNSATGKIVTQLPIDCKDYIMIFGAYGKTMAYYKGE